MNISAEVAKDLVFYATSDTNGVLAPRGWQCKAGGGSTLFTLTASPSGENKDGLRVVQYLIPNDGTPGSNATMAQFVLKLFPARGRSWIKFMVKNGDLTAEDAVNDFDYSPDLTDRLTYHGAQFIEFKTPANKNGLASSFFKQSSLPIYGWFDFTDGEEGGMTMLAVRLPAELFDLRKAILDNK